MRLRRAPRDADNTAARIHIPVRRAKAGEGGHKVDPARIAHALCQRIALVRGRDDLQLVAQPLNGRTRVENAALDRVGRFAADVPAHGRHQSRARAHRRIADIHQRETARAVGVFGLSARKAALTEERRLLVARCAADRHARECLKTFDPLCHRPVNLGI